MGTMEYLEQQIVYSEERGTWNLFVNGEWYAEDKDYERIEEMYFNNCCYDSDDDYEEYEYDYGYDCDYEEY